MLSLAPDASAAYNLIGERMPGGAGLPLRRFDWRCSMQALTRMLNRVRRPGHPGHDIASGPRVVIVGAGFGGLKAAQALRDAPVRLSVVDQHNYHEFQPLLYQVATADLSPADISAPIRLILRRQRNAEVLMSEVTGVDAERRVVLAREPASGQIHELPFDYLILATGAGSSYFGHDEWAQYAPGLKWLADATDIRRKVLLAFEAAELESDPERQRALLTFVVVGGGPTGVEMAGAIADLAHRALASEFRRINPASAHILLVEAMPRILSAFPETLAERARRELERLGVQVRTGAPVQVVDAGGVVVAGERIPASTIIWAAGVSASPVGRWLDVATDRAGRVLVHTDLSAPGHPRIFVVGDAAHLEQDGKLLPGVAPVAMQEGTYVGRLIRRRLAGELTPPFRYRDKGNLATIGRLYAIADFARLRLRLWGPLAWLVWAVVHILYLISFRNRLVVMTQWAWAYLTRQRGARIITELPAGRRVSEPASPAPSR
jgi:NADH dehydrogenase